MIDFGGGVLFLDRDNINTDEILPARHLTEWKWDALAPHLLEDLALPGFHPTGGWRGVARVAVARANFGCGSSREHAPWALAANGITTVVASSFARIFRQNMVNLGLLPAEVAEDDLDRAFRLGDGTACAVSWEERTLTFTSSDGRVEAMPFSLSSFDAKLIEAGGWVAYAERY